MTCASIDSITVSGAEMDRCPTNHQASSGTTSLCQIRLDYKAEPSAPDAPSWFLCSDASQNPQALFRNIHRQAHACPRAPLCVQDIDMQCMGDLIRDLCRQKLQRDQMHSLPRPIA